MGTAKTARERVRAEMIDEIKTAARRRLASGGAAGLSLRAVARDLGMVSSAVYRYFASRDDLLTALIIDAYDSLGECAERAAARSAQQPPRERWLAVSRAIRRWALRQPNEWALLFGSPVPNYRAPEVTVSHAARVALALVTVVRDAKAAGALRSPRAAVEVPPPVQAELEALTADLDVDLGPDVAGELVLAWTQLFGLISFELFGHLRGVVEHNEAFYAAVADHLASRVGL